MARTARVMRYILAAATIAVCLLLCFQAIVLYVTGNSPENFSAPGVRINPVYTREEVGARLKTLAPALLGYLALTVGGLAVQAAAEEAPSRLRSPFQPEDQLYLLRRRTGELPPEALAEERRRRIIRTGAGAVVLLCAVPAAVYLLNGDHFSNMDLEPVVGSMLLHVGPWTALGLAAAGVASALCARSARREAELLKSAPRTGPCPDGENSVSRTDSSPRMDEKRVPRTDPSPRPDGKKSAVPILRAVLYAAAVVFLVLGVVNGGLWDVLVKAVNICTECIGLG